MSQDSPNPPEGSQNISTNRPHTGVESLMSSLISPGPGTPGQGQFPGPWLGIQDWPGAFPSTFATAPVDPLDNVNQESFQQNGEDYTPHEASAAQAGPFISNVLQGGGGPTSLQTHPQSTTSPSVSQNRIPNDTASPSKNAHTKEAAAENAKKLKDLRAQLLAKKTKESREPSPVVKSKSSESQNKENSTLSPKTVPKVSFFQKAMSNGTGNPSTKPHGSAAASENQTPVASKDGIIAGLDELFADVRDENDARKETSNGPGKDQVNGVLKPLTNTTSNPAATTSVSIPHRPSSSQQIPSPDLSEGEIRSDEESQPVSKPNQPSKKPEISKEASLESEEKSRRESETEAAYKKPAAPSRDSQEKLRRASQVDLAYSPLRKSSATSAKTGKPPLDTTAVHRKLNNLNQTPKSAIENSSRPWISQSKPRAAEYDSYVPTYKKSALSDRKLDDEHSTLGKRTAAGDRIDGEAKRRAIEQNERAAMEYKKALEARPQPERVFSHTETVYLGRAEDERKEPGKAAAVARPVLEDPDLADWLELTEYNDESYRQSRLARFRKKKELDRMRLQLEEEEQIELQKRTMLRSTRLGSEAATVKMAPPSLVLRGGDADTIGGIVHATAESQVSTPTMKRHNAEELTDSRSKIARVDTTRGNGPSVKDETSPTFSTIPFENRISRDDGHIGSRNRRRSRSPERYRRRSASPEFRRNSVPDFAHNKRTCHNCGETGHYQTTCTVPRRDGRDRYRAAQPKPRFDGVSPNYMGKKPQHGYKDPRAAVGYSSVNRSIDDDDKRP